MTKSKVAKIFVITLLIVNPIVIIWDIYTFCHTHAGMTAYATIFLIVAWLTLLVTYLKCHRYWRD